MNHLDTHSWVPEFEKEHNGTTSGSFLDHLFILELYYATFIADMCISTGASFFAVVV